MLAHAHSLLADGADIIDLGASSSRPGATLLPPDVEAARLVSALRLLRSELPDAIISVDTCYSLPARAAIEAGADIINDIGGGDVDPAMPSVVAEMQVPYIVMHGAPKHLDHSHQASATSDDPDIVDSLVRFFSAKLDTYHRLGITDIWLDPGFGFGKSLDENYHILFRLRELTTLFSEPLLVGISRKSMIYRRLGTTPDQALVGTIALDALALDAGARIVRVHDPRPAADTVNLLFPHVQS